MYPSSSWQPPRILFRAVFSLICSCSSSLPASSSSLVSLKSDEKLLDQLSAGKNLLITGWSSANSAISPLRWVAATVVPVIVVSWGHQVWILKEHCYLSFADQLKFSEAFSFYFWFPPRACCGFCPLPCPLQLLPEVTTVNITNCNKSGILGTIKTSLPPVSSPSS